MAAQIEIPYYNAQIQRWIRDYFSGSSWTAFTLVYKIAFIIQSIFSSDSKQSEH